MSVGQPVSRGDFSCDESMVSTVRRGDRMSRKKYIQKAHDSIFVVDYKDAH